VKILVTGATGFFGKAITDRLRKAGHEVIGAARRPAEGMEKLDVASPESCLAVLARHPGLDAVVHSAAIAHADDGAFSEAQYRATNAEGARNMIEAAIAHGARCFVQISTVSVYGEFDLPAPVPETAALRPLGLYGECKKAGEDFCAARADRIRLTTLRMATMYGDDWLFNIRRKVTPPRIGRYCYLTFDGAGRRYSLCSNRNGAEAVLWAVEDRLAAGTYNVADFHDYSLNDVMHAVKQVEGSKPAINIPRPLAKALLGSLVRLARTPQARQNAFSRYWKFYEHNRYATDRLRAAGFTAPAHLLEIAAGTQRAPQTV
jgi:nucleoside-diphosphate-sugar epimerase